jgi:hypothetical protein
MQPEMSALWITKNERLKEIRSVLGIFAKEKYSSIAIAN